MFMDFVTEIHFKESTYDILSLTTLNNFVFAIYTIHKNAYQNTATHETKNNT